MSIAERLKEARGAKSQKAAALLCGITQPVWNRYENGESLPGAESILKICKTFGVSADWLLGITDTQGTPSITAGGDVVVGNGSRITKTVHVAPTPAPCAKCPYKALVSRLRKAGMTFPELAQ